MSISKERLNEIALEVASKLQGVPEFFNSEGGFEWTLFHKAFARALLKAVEAESEVVATVRDTFDGYTDVVKLRPLNDSMRLIALPLVEGD